jgi:hypothetical protein
LSSRDRVDEIQNLWKQLNEQSERKGQKLKGASDQQQFNRNIEDFEVWMAEIEGNLMSEDFGKVSRLACAKCFYILLSLVHHIESTAAGCALSFLSMHFVLHNHVFIFLVGGKRAMVVNSGTAHSTSFSYLPHLWCIFPMAFSNTGSAKHNFIFIIFLFGREGTHWKIL